MSQLKIEIGLAIKAAREKQGIIQGVLAERSGVSRVLIGLIERGQYNNPSVTVLEKIADGLGMELAVNFKEGEL